MLFSTWLAGLAAPFVFPDRPNLPGKGVSSIPLEISDLFNNHATGSIADFESGGSGYPHETGCLPEGGSIWNLDGVGYRIPKWGGQLDGGDNIVAENQYISLEPTFTSSIHFLLAGDGTDGSSEQDLRLHFVAPHDPIDTVVDVKTFWSIHYLNKAAIRCPFHWTSDGSGGRVKNFNTTHIHHVSLPVISDAKLVGIELPGRAGWNAMHIFAITLIPQASLPDTGPRLPTPLPAKPIVDVKSVKALHKIKEFPTLPSQQTPHRPQHVFLPQPSPSSIKAQLLEVTLFSPYSAADHRKTTLWMTRPHSVSIEPHSIIPGRRGIHTVQPGIVSRVGMGDTVKVQVWVEIREPFPGIVNVKISPLDSDAIEKEWTISGVAVSGRILFGDDEDWGSDPEDQLLLEEHYTPDWWTGSKFGIFVHWGLFSVPAFMVGGRYAEWYDWYLHLDSPGSELLAHHKETYGENFTYDDFIPMFSGNKFNASEWLSIFSGAGANYFVLTTKHHDGFALFDTEDTSGRNSVKLGPKRDFLKELMDTSKKEFPDMHRGTYFSMPEWFAPSYQRYGWVSWPGGLAHNPFHPEELETYTGYVEVADYVDDLQAKQMAILMERYETEIMWCDIGGANHTAPLAREWYRNASRSGREVTMNNRCGVGPDFDTPEYQTFATVQEGHWEVCEGLDPYSFGYNADTKDEDYRSVKEVIHNVIDITAKGGNYLLNVGPDGEGKIPDVMKERLLGVGKWLKHSGRCIYNTTTYPLLPEWTSRTGDSFRFTRTDDTFCIISLSPIPHDGIIRISAPLPVVFGDSISLLGGGPHASELRWMWFGDELRITIPQEFRKHSWWHDAWAFEVKYGDGPL